MSFPEASVAEIERAVEAVEKRRLDKGDAEVYFDQDWAMVYGALDFIRSYRGEAPYCLFLPIGYPHPPYCVEEPWFSGIKRAALPGRVVMPDSPKPSMRHCCGPEPAVLARGALD